jgi:nitroreductase
MDVKEALEKRHSVRAFRPDPVEPEKLRTILQNSLRTPSWANSQPWEVYVATGATLERIKQGFKDAYESKTKVTQDIPRPKEWSEKAKARQMQLNPDMARDCGDSVKEFGHLNQVQFNAPAVIYIGMDKVLGEWSLYDIGAFTQSVMLSAVEEGLDTIPAIQLVNYPEVIRAQLDIPEDILITIGIAIGYSDTEHGINKFHSARDPFDSVVKIYD